MQKCCDSIIISHDNTISYHSNYLDFTLPFDRYQGVSFDILPPTNPNHLVSFDYQQGFSAIFVSIPCFLPKDKVHDFFKSCGLYTSS